MIANGRVKVNGRVAKIGDKVDTKKDKITVDNKTVVSSVRSVYSVSYTHLSKLRHLFGWILLLYWSHVSNLFQI